MQLLAKYLNGENNFLLNDHEFMCIALLCTNNTNNRAKKKEPIELNWTEIEENKNEKKAQK